MKAVVAPTFGSIEALRLQDWPDPVPGAGEVVVDVMAAGVNFPDLLVTGGLYQILPTPPFIPGKEAAGVVSAVGEGVHTCAVGDRVLVLVESGAYCERLLAPQANCFVLPRSMDFLEAAGFALVFQTAHFALIDRANLQPGEVVLVTGAAGGVGLACVQLAKALGARVLAGVSTADKGRVALAAGADAIIDLSGPDLRNSIRDDVRARTDGKGADVVLEIVGGNVFDGAFRALAWRGRLVVLGFAGGRIPDIPANRILLRNVTVTGLHWSDYREWHPEWMRRAQFELFGLYEKGLLHTELGGTYPLDAAPQAMAELRDRRVKGKVVLTTDRWRRHASGSPSQ
ncbi:MAG: NADPH:quinone oxidoreductase family protein [Burkholderiaceae bacterium]|nr:NADPH:quinone oxidoreductase family protein [Burkholderiaceae bacterium]